MIFFTEKVMIDMGIFFIIVLVKCFSTPIDEKLQVQILCLPARTRSTQSLNIKSVQHFLKTPISIPFLTMSSIEIVKMLFLNVLKISKLFGENYETFLL